MRAGLLPCFVVLVSLVGCGSGGEAPSGADSFENTGRGMIKDVPPKPKGTLPKAGAGPNAMDTTTPP